MQGYTDLRALKIKQSDLKDLKPEVRQIYDHRLNLQSMTERRMVYLQDILALNLQQHDLEDLEPKVRQIYARRVKMQLMTVQAIENFVDIIAHAKIE